ncbi:transmembrane protein, putative [Medicago truncatula]|uniref:Transmembrane protein, putative n=1 Tax=Medicago truncatula TaxID=3880 RepID=A0A072TSD2_MEDTR|nr:transmembrane protein, putative [Medicago truncatula]
MSSKINNNCWTSTIRFWSQIKKPVVFPVSVHLVLCFEAGNCMCSRAGVIATLAFTDLCVCCFAVCLLFEFRVAKDGNKNESMCLSMSVLPIGEWI